MVKMQTKPILKDQETYVYIDVSNIRSACLRTLGFRVDFIRLLKYFKDKYPRLREVRYYEGIVVDDEKKRKTFSALEREGYVICPLERKSYKNIETIEKNVKCPKCGHKWTTKLRKERKMLKSNVDVYLATELLTIAHQATRPTHIILVSCDGDYAEMIKNALENDNVSISVLATPPVQDHTKNTLSVKLRVLRRDTSRYRLLDISNFKDKISH